MLWPSSQSKALRCPFTWLSPGVEFGTPGRRLGPVLHAHSSVSRKWNQCCDHHHKAKHCVVHSPELSPGVEFGTPGAKAKGPVLHAHSSVSRRWNKCCDHRHKALRCPFAWLCPGVEFGTPGWRRACHQTSTPLPMASDIGPRCGRPVAASSNEKDKILINFVFAVICC